MTIRRWEKFTNLVIAFKIIFGNFSDLREDVLKNPFCYAFEVGLYLLLFVSIVNYI